MSRNKNLVAKIANESAKPSSSSVKIKPKTVKKITPAPNTKNISGHEAYSLTEFRELMNILLSSKVQPTAYQSEKDVIFRLEGLIDKIAEENPYFAAQCIVYARAYGEMRTINNIAAVFLSNHLSGYDWSSRFYSRWDKKSQKGGVIFRIDDMISIKDFVFGLNKIKESVAKNKNKTFFFTKAMKKGFANVLETSDAYSIGKYRKGLVDIVRLSHPNQKNCKTFVDVDDSKGKGKINILEALVYDRKFDVDTWEKNNSQAGQIVAKAVQSGEISKNDAEKILKEAKSENWKGMLKEDKLGILAAIRNIRNIHNSCSGDYESKNLLNNLLTNTEKIRQGKIMPYQMYIADLVVKSEGLGAEYSKILSKGMEAAVPNLDLIFPGRNLVIVDESGSMTSKVNFNENNLGNKTGVSCFDLANLFASMIFKGTDKCDVIRFGSSAEYVSLDKSRSIFDISRSIYRDMGGTNLSTAWSLVERSGRKYDRVFILSDNECNRGSFYSNFSNILSKIGSPKVYSIDLAYSKTNAVPGHPDVSYFGGFGLQIFDEIKAKEISYQDLYEKVLKISI